MNASTTLSLLPSWFFVDVGENLIMVENVATPSNPLVSLIEKEELEEASLDMNVFQPSCKGEPSIRMVHI